MKVAMNGCKRKIQYEEKDVDTSTMKVIINLDKVSVDGGKKLNNIYNGFMEKILELDLPLVMREEFHLLYVSALFLASAILDIIIAVWMYGFLTCMYVGKIIPKIGPEKGHLLTHTLSLKSRTSDLSKVFLISF